MGNTESILEGSKYIFKNPIVGGVIDMNFKKVYIIDTAERVEAAEDSLTCNDIIYVDCEGHYFGSRSSRLGLIQIATSTECCFLFDVIKYPRNFLFLKKLLESNTIRKVFHDCSGDASALYQEVGIDLKNVEDTQVAQKVIDKSMSGCLSTTSGPSLEELYGSVLLKKFPAVKLKKPTSLVVNRWTHVRPLTEDMIKYAALDVLALAEIFHVQKRWIDDQTLYRSLVQKQLNLKRKLSSESTLVPRAHFSELRPSSAACGKREPVLSQEENFESVAKLAIGGGLIAAGLYILMSAKEKKNQK